MDCQSCGRVLVTDDELDLQLCETCRGLERDQSNDPAWLSEQRLRDMEGSGNYEGPITWP